MKQITLQMHYGREIHGTLEKETDNYYEIIVEKVTPGDLLKKSEWQKGDKIKVNKQLIINVK